MRRNSLFLPCLLCLFFLVFRPGESTGAVHWAKKSPEQAPATVYGGAAQMRPGAVTVRPAGTLEKQGALDDYDDDASGGESIADPLEPWNRFWFGFNNFCYLHIVKPIHQGYAAVTPRQFRSGMKNFFFNLFFPVRFVNNIFQFRFMEAGVEFGRFIINTTTSLGFANVAKDKKTIVPVEPGGEDFGQTLGSWGIGHGFYIVWPVIGPSSPRDTLGRIGNLFADPLFYVSPWELATGAELYLRFNDMDDILPLYEEMNRAAVDPYIAMRQAYVNLRRIQVAR
ncbi:MAG: VacJ family lipoprotein [Desulfovibrio sp.]|jgi:phospholipid-binding lipoprotein MlaA|nr:VacJ family lipoprotein [Desulfovibrio sp.]